MQDLSKMSDELTWIQKLSNEDLYDQILDIENQRGHITGRLDHGQIILKTDLFNEYMRRLSLADKFKWQDIKDAPKDGTKLLITAFNERREMHVASWQEIENRTGWLILSVDYYHPKWDAWLYKPTHFMPLPSPPEDKGE